MVLTEGYTYTNVNVSADLSERYDWTHPLLAGCPDPRGHARSGAPGNLESAVPDDALDIAWTTPVGATGTEAVEWLKPGASGTGAAGWTKPGGATKTGTVEWVKPGAAGTGAAGWTKHVG